MINDIDMWLNLRCHMLWFHSLFRMKHRCFLLLYDVYLR